ncbi:MAG: hypothetical protein HYZ04_01040, partial [Rhodospirillales bacterium]|nr:hypothetical protein [Rhodospirillales bacterium]
MRPRTSSPARSGPRNDIRTLRTLLPYLWPQGDAEIRLRVVAAMVLL